MHYRVTHRTQYRYEEPVSLSHNLLLLIPRVFQFQSRNRFQVRINPNPSLIEETLDRFGNQGRYFEIHKPHEVLTITTVSDVTTWPRMMPDPLEGATWEQVVERIRADADGEARTDRLFVQDSPLAASDESLRAFAAPSFTPGRPALAALLDLTERIHREFRYMPGTTDITTPIGEVMARREGVCQDFAHLQIACLRTMGLAARYVSGYLETLPPPGKPRLVGADASHAWLEAKLPGLGWIPLDPTNNMIAGERHVTVAWGRDYSDVTPVSGVIIGGSQHVLEVSVDVLPVDDPAQLSGAGPFYQAYTDTTNPNTTHSNEGPTP